MDITIDVIIAFAIGLALLLLLGKLLITPLKLLMKLLINGVIGGVMLWVLNTFGAYIGVMVVINPVTALIAGLLGVPGVIMILLLQVILG
jgi:inhibitor of the pro-sigma K processing machinery